LVFGLNDPRKKGRETVIPLSIREGNKKKGRGCGSLWKKKRKGKGTAILPETVEREMQAKEDKKGESPIRNL